MILGGKFCSINDGLNLQMLSFLSWDALPGLYYSQLELLLVCGYFWLQTHNGNLHLSTLSKKLSHSARRICCEWQQYLNNISPLMSYDRLPKKVWLHQYECLSEKFRDFQSEVLWMATKNGGTLRIKSPHWEQLKKTCCPSEKKAIWAPGPTCHLIVVNEKCFFFNLQS